MHRDKTYLTARSFTGALFLHTQLVGGVAKTMVSWWAFPSLPPRAPQPSSFSSALNSPSFPFQTPITQASQGIEPEVSMERYDPELETYCWFSHDVTKIQTKKLSILPRFYFHDALEQLKTKFHTNFRFKRVLGFVIEDA